MPNQIIPKNDLFLEDDDVQAMVRLMATVSMQVQRHEQIRILMDGIKSMIQAKAWVWGMNVRLQADALPAWLLHFHGGFTEETFAKFMRAQEHPDLQEITAPFSRLLQEKWTHLTRTREQTDPQGIFTRSGARPLWDEAGVSPGIMSCRPLENGDLSVAAIFRGVDGLPFSERERRIAHILLTEVPWLHIPVGSEVVSPAKMLSPRRLTICNLLILGHTRNGIAAQLGLSVNTINSYVKDILGHFNANSQAQLMVRFREGNGNDAD